MRSAVIDRQTAETDIHCQLNLDGSGHCQVSTGIGFFDHMMNLFAFHGGFDLVLEADGDLDVDDHHTIGDCGIALGQAFKKALGERTGIERYGFFLLPMDESLAEIALDISGRPYLVFNCEFSRDQIGMMATEMVEEFMRAFAFNAGITLHVSLRYGNNDHHRAEAIFKGLGHALKNAVTVSSDRVMSTNGTLE